MKPILFESTETAFDTNGLGVLSDCHSCYVDEERNGPFILEAEYPISGRWYKEITDRRIILAKPNREQEPQPFRITRIAPSFKGGKTSAKIKAVHWSYDLSGVPVLPFSTENLAGAVTSINMGALTDTVFTLSTNKSATGRMQSLVPRSFRQLLGGYEGSLLDVYGGEYRFGRYTVELLSSRGSDNGFSIRFGKNMTELDQERDSSAVYTGVYPYWTGENGAYFELPERIVALPGVFLFTKILTLDCSDDFQEQPTETQLRDRAMRYMIDNGVGVPNINTKVSYAQHPRLLDAVKLCDTVHVYYDALGVNATAKVIKTRYDVLKDRYEYIELGKAKSSFTNTIANVNTAIDDQRRELIQQAQNIKKELEETIDALRVSITNEAENAATMIRLTADGINQTVSRLSSSVSAILDVNGEIWTAIRTNSEDLVEIEDIINAELTQRQTYIRFLPAEPAIVLGYATGAYIKIKIVNNVVYFYSGSDTDSFDNVTPFAYFKPDEFYDERIVAGNTLQIGKENNAKWVYQMQSNGDLVLDRI